MAIKESCDVIERGRQVKVRPTFFDHLRRIENSPTEIQKAEKCLVDSEDVQHFSNRYDNMVLALGIVESDVDTVFSNINNIYAKYVEDANTKTISDIKAAWKGFQKNRFLRFLTCLIVPGVIMTTAIMLWYDIEMLGLVPFTSAIFAAVGIQIYDLFGYSCDFVKTRKHMRLLEKFRSTEALMELAHNDIDVYKFLQTYNKEKTK